MSKIPTAWNLMTSYPNSGCNEQEAAYDWNDIEEMMIKFAKLHVKEALEAATNNATTMVEYPNNFRIIVVDKESILNSYPLENIK